MKSCMRRQLFNLFYKYSRCFGVLLALEIQTGMPL